MIEDERPATQTTTRSQQTATRQATDDRRDRGANRTGQQEEADFSHENFDNISFFPFFSRETFSGIATQRLATSTILSTPTAPTLIHQHAFSDQLETGPEGRVQQDGTVNKADETPGEASGGHEEMSLRKPRIWWQTHCAKTLRVVSSS